MTNLSALPDDLPRPEDDGACDHLQGRALPRTALPATSGPPVDLGDPAGGLVVAFCYPRTGVPGQANPEGWDAIPGARGCTPQACSFRDLHAEFAARGARVYGVSAQDPDYQREAAERLRLPYPLLSDATLAFADALGLPTFEAAEMRLHRRATLILRDGTVARILYPVFPPDRSADDALAALDAGV